MQSMSKSLNRLLVTGIDCGNGEIVAVVAGLGVALL